MIKGAIIDATGEYRYQLWRIWDESKPLVVFIMLNPSTADAEEDDRTIRRCMNYSRSWGFGGIKVVNLFAYRATNPTELKTASDPIGPLNNQYILDAVNSSDIVIAAWGTHGSLHNRDKKVIRIFEDKLQYLGLSKDGHPKHPLYLKADLRPVKWAI